MSLSDASARIDRVLSRKMTLLNHTTGEVFEKNEEIRLKAKTREEFFLVFVNNFRYLTDVPKMSLKVLASILTHYVTWNNEILLNVTSRKDLAEKSGTTVAVVYKSISNLIENGIFVKQNSRLFLNPYIFSRGTWNDIQKMRQEIVFDYDFEKLEAKTSLNVTSLDKSVSHLGKVEVVEYNNYKEGNVEHIDVVIDKKEDIDKENVIDVDFEKKEEKETNNKPTALLNSHNNFNEKEIELEILKENNRATELRIKELELQIKLKKIESDLRNK